MAKARVRIPGDGDQRFPNDREGAKLQYLRVGQEKHVLFGWLCVGEILRITNVQDAYEWTHYHSHVYDNCRSNNVVYIAADKAFDDLPGAGIFTDFHPKLQLTEKGQSCSIWELPNWFSPDASPLSRNSYLCKNGKPDGQKTYVWRDDSPFCTLSAAPSVALSHISSLLSAASCPPPGTGVHFLRHSCVELRTQKGLQQTGWRTFSPLSFHWLIRRPVPRLPA